MAEAFGHRCAGNGLYAAIPQKGANMREDAEKGATMSEDAEDHAENEETMPGEPRAEEGSHPTAEERTMFEVEDEELA
jgi:hypothetical protein